MSHLESVARDQLKTQGQFTFLGDDGYTVTAHDLDGVLGIAVLNPHGDPTFDHYGDFNLLLRHLKAHGGHLHH